MAFSIARVAFWVINLSSFIKWRDLPYLPGSLALAYSIAVCFDLLPMFAWNEYFTSRTYKNGEFVFYLMDLAPTMTVFVLTMCLSTLRSESQSTWSNFSRKISLILPYIWPKKSISLQIRVALCLFLLLFGRLINVALPLYSKWIGQFSFPFLVDFFVFQWVFDGLAHPETFQYSLIYISTLLKFLQGNGAMGGFLNTLRSYLWIPIQQYTTRELEVELFAHLHSLSLRWHLSRKTGLVLRVMDRGTSSVNSILNYILFNIVPTITDIAIAVVFFFSTFNFYFGGIVFVTMVLYLVVTIYVTEWRTKFRRDMNEKENASSAIATDSLLNYETVKYYGNETYEVDRFRHAIECFQLAEWRSNASLALLNFLQNGLIGLGMTAGSVLVAYLITVDHQLTILLLQIKWNDILYKVGMTYFTLSAVGLFLFSVTTCSRTIQKSFIDMENMFDLMNEEVDVRDSPHAIEYHPTEGKISVNNLVFSYNENRVVLDGISFEVGSGQSVALVGPSGSGKSTLVRLLFRLFECPEGSILYDGTDVRKLKLKSLRKQIGIVPQDTVLFNDTIKYNIRFGRPTATDEEIYEAAKAAMIHDKILSLPEGYDTLVGERGLKLSGGEKQRVAIARTILKKPQFIFLDEATSALDTNTERAIQRCLEELCSTRTGVVVAHRLSTVVNVDCILVLDKGRIIERGRHSDLIAAKGVYYQMWESQNSSENSGNGSP
ncbi:ABC transporter, ATP-binding protein [Necator americanus]|uniref:ABC transporter, ATP-binding protein n=1 Tax=Necator americanus TaxID=51031 RepID=W2T588_NECAM|nr:ABC transporter, ATP-binding protein [Necator americanus]ETN76137.1 ABC transporter, ATP-binding protein [Necator americanus]